MSNINKNIHGYVIKQQIGTGSYGVVYKVEKDNIIYVLKQIPINPNSTMSQINSVKNEAKILSSLNSKYVVQYFDSFEENNCLNIIMEYCEGGDLGTYLTNYQKKNIGTNLNEDFIWKVFIQICFGLYDIHKQNILHRDLKSLNIFLTKSLEVKIGDLGVARMLQNTQYASTFIGTPLYLSPEICEEKPYNEKSDVWALGCILYEMASFKHPFNAKNQPALFLKILNGKFEPLPPKVPSDIKKMVDKLLEKNYFKRPSMKEIILNPLFINKVQKMGMFDNLLEYFDMKQIDQALKEVKKITIRKIVLPNAKPHQVSFYPSTSSSSKRYFNSNSHLRISSGKKTPTKKPVSAKSKDRMSKNGSNYNLNNRNSNQLINPFPKTPPKFIPTENSSGKKNPILIPKKVGDIPKPILLSKEKKKEPSIDLNDFMKVLSKKQNENNTLSLSNFIEEGSSSITVETNLTSEPPQNQLISNSLSDVESEEEKDTDENVIMIKEENILTPKEKEDLINLREKYKEKYNHFLEEIKKSFKSVDIDTIFEIYKEIEDNGAAVDIDLVIKKIEDYIKEKIPTKAKMFIELFTNLIFYQIQYKNTEKEIEKSF